MDSEKQLLEEFKELIKAINSDVLEATVLKKMDGMLTELKAIDVRFIPAANELNKAHELFEKTLRQHIELASKLDLTPIISSIEDVNKMVSQSSDALKSKIIEVSKSTDTCTQRILQEISASKIENNTNMNIIRDKASKIVDLVSNNYASTESNMTKKTDAILGKIRLTQEYITEQGTTQHKDILKVEEEMKKRLKKYYIFHFGFLVIIVAMIGVCIWKLW